MSHKRYYLVLLLVLCSSVLFLGLSYSAYSGENNYIVNEEKTEGLRVVYGSDNTILSGDSVDIGVTNLTNEEKVYKIIVKEINGETNKTYYKINDGEEQELIGNTIYSNNISAYGTNGDYEMNKITVYGSNKTVKYTLNVVLDYKEETNDSK